MQKTPVFYFVGNKLDLVINSSANHQIINALNSVRHHHQSHHHHDHHHMEPPPAFKDLAAMVRKQWKSSYWEVSALYHWRIHRMFEFIVSSQCRQEHEHEKKDIDTSDHTGRISSRRRTSPHAKCSIL